jgi:hypothetical protein
MNKLWDILRLPSIAYGGRCYRITMLGGPLDFPPSRERVGKGDAHALANRVFVFTSSSAKTLARKDANVLGERASVVPQVFLRIGD